MEICEVKVRNEFFVAALFIESALTDYLSEKLNIKQATGSGLLGHKKRSMSFDQKVDALLDSSNLTIIEKSKLSVFREIYKEFMQHKNACSLEESFASPDNNDDFLLILYPQNDYLPREEKLINACYQLIGEVSELVARQTEKVEVKMTRRKYFQLDSLRLGRFAFLLSFFFIT